MSEFIRRRKKREKSIYDFRWYRLRVFKKGWLENCLRFAAGYFAIRKYSVDFVSKEQGQWMAVCLDYLLLSMSNVIKPTPLAFVANYAFYEYNFTPDASVEYCGQAKN